MTRFRVVALVLGLAIAWACSDRTVDDVDEEALCTERCGWQLDPECGVEDPGYDSVAECVDVCAADDDQGFAWGECTDLHVAYYDCLRGLTCEERRVHFTDVLNSQCFEEQNDLTHCSAEANRP
jgi:hypothetical protein